MPLSDKATVPGRTRSAGRRAPRGQAPSRVRLQMPVTGMEAEFNVVLDGVEIDPRAYWGRPDAFIDRPMLSREKSSYQIPTGGAVYFDRGVIEVVTPVIELAPGCSARVVRNLWEQIAFVRDALTRWEKRAGHDVRLKAYSTHYNVSFELPRSEQGKDRNVEALALLLAYILPMPMAPVATNRRSTGLGVRPRGNRIEITADFTPDPSLMVASASLVVGIVREVISWPSYSLSLLDRLPIPTVAGVVPGKHTTRQGWLTKDYHYPLSPFTADLDDPVWNVRDGRTLSLRAMGREAAWYFRHAIRRYSDPFSFRLLFAVLSGRAPSLLELEDRPGAYEDVGRLCRWGAVLPALTARAAGRSTAGLAWSEGSFAAFRADRERERAAYRAELGLPAPPSGAPARAVTTPRRPRPVSPTWTPRRALRTVASAVRARRSVKAAAAGPSLPGGLPSVAENAPPPPGAPTLSLRAVRSSPPPPLRAVSPRDRRLPDGEGYAARRKTRVSGERRKGERRAQPAPIPFPDRRLSRSAYERVFLKLVSGGRLRIGRDTYTPVGMKGWYQAIFRRDSDGRERLLTIDQLLRRMDGWER